MKLSVVKSSFNGVVVQMRLDGEGAVYQLLLERSVCAFNGGETSEYH